MINPADDDDAAAVSTISGAISIMGSAIPPASAVDPVTIVAAAAKIFFNVLPP